MVNWNTLQYEDCTDIDNFIIKFQKNLEKLQQLDLKMDDQIHPVLFINALNKAFPIWADHQRVASRIAKPLMEALYKDIRDDVRQQQGNKSHGNGLQVLYGGKPPPSTDGRGGYRGDCGGRDGARGGGAPPSGSDHKDRKESICDTCKRKGHFTKDCFENSKKAQSEYQKMYKKDYIMVSNFNLKKSKKKKEDV